MSIQDYNDGKAEIAKHNGSENFVKVSPSGIADFFASTRKWYGENLLNEEGFQGSAPTLLGSIVHYFAEQAALKANIVDPDALVREYLDKQTIDFDENEILPYWKEMSNLLVNSSVTTTQHHSVEQFMFEALLPGIYVGGTYDALVPLGDSTYSIKDYKTASSKPSKIPYNYRMQAHTYAWLLTKKRYKISQIELAYVIKPTKTLPERYFSFKEPFTEEDLNKIDGQLKLIANSVKLWNEQPELRYILAQDYRLFQKPKPVLFKD